MPTPEDFTIELALCRAASKVDRVYVRELATSPGFAVGRDVLGRAAIILAPLRGGLAFRTPSVEFYPNAHIEFENSSEPSAISSRDCMLVLYDESGLGGVLRELMPVLIWGLSETRTRSGEAAAITFIMGLSAMLRGDRDPVDRYVIQGLWAELLLIAYSTQPELLLGAWHEDPDEAYDFSLGDERLEVKSSSGAQRRHRFSSSQLPPRAGVELYVASVLVQRVAGGRTLFDLLQLIKSRVKPASAVEVFQKTLAVAPLAALAERAFDSASASASLALYRGADVPAIKLPQNILQATWTADLTHVPQVQHSVSILLAASRQV